MVDSCGDRDWARVPSTSPGLSWGLRLRSGLILRCSKVQPRAQGQAHQVGQAQVTHDGREDAHTGRDEVGQGGGLGIHATCAETPAAGARRLVLLAPAGLTTLVPLPVMTSSSSPLAPSTLLADKPRTLSPLPMGHFLVHLLCARCSCMLLTL